MTEPRFGLKPETIQKIQAVFALHPGVDEVILYGSRAKGNYKSGSDIDLTVRGPNLSHSELLKIDNEIDDLLLPYKIDLSLFHRIENEDLLDHISRVGIKFYPVD